jgi:hypothetical protein
MRIKELLRIAVSILIFISGLVALLGGYVASHALKSTLLIIVGVVLGAALIILASALAEERQTKFS